MRWFTSDTHFRHNNVIEYDKRPFASIEEMEEEIIKRWNNVVSKKDIVYHCGDFMFGNPKKAIQITSRLNGDILLVRGNHDLQNRYTHKRCFIDGNHMFSDISDIECITIEGRRIVITHYPYDDFCFAQFSPRNIGNWHIHGHVHCDRPTVTKREINVCCCMWDYTPVSEKQILKILMEEDNGPI